MRIQEDQYTYSAENRDAELSVLTVLGHRSEQQDCLGLSADEDGEIYALLCDGMGGHSGGREASRAAVDYLLAHYVKGLGEEEIPSALVENAIGANETVLNLKDAAGAPLNGGSTLVSVLIRDKKLFWCGVGDSRAYLRRGREFVQISSDHTYKAYLDFRKEQGEIEAEEYDREMARGEALISFLGIPELKLIDYSNSPIRLESGDQVILMSDGLYKLMGEDVLCELLQNISSLPELLRTLEMRARHIADRNRFSRDNMTVIIIRIK